MNPRPGAVSPYTPATAQGVAITVNIDDTQVTVATGNGQSLESILAAIAEAINVRVAATPALFDKGVHAVVREVVDDPRPGPKVVVTPPNR